MELDTLAAAPGVLEDHPAGADIAGADERAVEGGRGRSKAVEVQGAQVAVAQVPASVGHLGLPVEQSVEAHERVGAAARLQHVDLKRVVEASVHQLHGYPYRDGRSGADTIGHVAQTAQELRALPS